MESGQEKEIEKEVQNENEVAESSEQQDAEKHQDEIRELNDKYVRLYSEFENFRRRTAKEKLELIANANEALLKDLIPVIDDFERAIEANQKNEDVKSIKEGFELLYNKYYSILSNKGLKPMNSSGKEFDVDEHEALTKIPAPSKKLKGKVVDVIEKGYFLNDKVLRFAKVVVGE